MEGGTIFAINPYYALAGALVGVLVGITGVGGGSLMTPILVLAFGFHPTTAVGTDLLFASVTKTIGGTVHGIRDTVDWRIVGRLALGSVPAALVTLWLLHANGSPSKAVEHIITNTLGVVLILTAISIMFRTQIVGWARRRLGPQEPRDRMVETILLGIVLGALVTISSVGAGAIGVTALLVLYPELPVNRIVGSDIAHAVPLTLVAGIGHLLDNSVNLPVLFALLIGSIPGIIVGSMIGSRAPERVIKPILATVLVIVGSKLLF